MADSEYRPGMFNDLLNAPETRTEPPEAETPRGPALPAAPYQPGTFSAQLDQPTVTAAPPAGPDPYSTYNTAARMGTDAIFGLPDLAISLHNAGLTPSAYVAEKIHKWTGKALPDIPMIAPAVRSHILNAQELPEDASTKRVIAEGVGSSLLGAGAPGLVKGIGKATMAVPAAIERRLPRMIDEVTRPGGIDAATGNRIPSALEAASTNAYTPARALDVRFNPDTLTKLADEAGFNISKLPRGVTDVNAPDTFTHLGRMSNAAPPSGAPYIPGTAHLTPNDIEKQRQIFNGVRTDWTRSPHDRAAAGEVVRTIDRFLENIPKSSIHPDSLNDPALASQLFREGRGNWAANERLNLLRGIEHAADARGGAGAVSGREAREVGNIRGRVGSILAAHEDPTGTLSGPLYGFRRPEVDALKAVSEGSGANRALRAIGENLAPTSLNPMRLAVAGTASALAGGGGYYGSGGDWSSAALGAAPVAAGTFSRWLANRGTRAALKNAEEVIAARSPLAASLGIEPPTANMAPTAARRNALAAAIVAFPSSEVGKRMGVNARDWLNQAYGSEEQP